MDNQYIKDSLFIQRLGKLPTDPKGSGAGACA
jgi:hypothetical protein